MKQTRKAKDAVQPPKRRPVRVCADCGLPLGDLDLAVKETYRGETSFYHVECHRTPSKT